MNEISFKSSFPRIRFNGIEDMWQHIELSDISVKVIEKNVKNDFDIVLTNSAEFGIVPQRDFFDKDIANLKSLSGYYVVQPNDFVYNPRISNKAPVGPIKANFLNITGVISPLYYVFRTQNIDVFFLAKYFDSSYWHKFMKLNGDTGARSDRFAIKDSVFKEMPIPFPSLAEQSAIGTLFRTLDDLLDSYKDNLTNYQSLKATMLSKMFPKAGQTVPDIRLDGFEGEWEEKEFGDVVKFYSGLTYKPSDVLSCGTLVLRSSNVRDGELIYIDNVFVNPDIVNCQNVKSGDIVVVVRNGSRDLIGKHALIRSEMPNTVIGAFMTGIRCDNPEFINSLLDTKMFISEIHRNLGSTINQITTGNFKRMKFYFPLKAEQQAIGSYFSNLDNLINSHQEKISQLETLKKKLLQDMFI